MTNDATLEERIGEWRSYLRRRQAVHTADVDELEDHLRSQVEALTAAGLSADEAFMVAVKRLGDIDAVSREFGTEYSERLWKQLVVTPGAEVSTAMPRRHAVAAVAFAASAAVALKVPELFGIFLSGPESDEQFYVRNIFFFVLPFLAGFFVFKRGMSKGACVVLAAPFIVAALVMNLMPFKAEGHTLMLSAMHLPIALWLMVGFAYAGGQWRLHQQRMNFVRFSGEWFIYYVLIALGGAALVAFTLFIFEAIGFKVEPVMERWIVPTGAAGAVIIAAWLVEAKQSVIENMAPVLTMLFTPLFTILLLVFIGAMIWTGNAITHEREVLIGFDLLLILVSALLLYSISARDSNAMPGRFDRLQLVLLVCALAVDAVALYAILARISEYGFSPNKTAALGLNILLLVNLGVSAVIHTQFLAKRAPFSRLERWQTSYLPVYAVWAWIVVALFPVFFKYQ